MEKYLGESIPKLGFGLMRLPVKDGAIDLSQTKDMVDWFLAEGFTYFDTAYGYGNGASEIAIGEALVKRRPRETYQLATKLPAWAGAKTKEEAEGMLAASLERTGAGYFDFYLLHNLGESRSKAFDDFGIWDFVQKKKAQGVLRHVGFSFHDKAQVLEDILSRHPEMEFVQLQINYADWESPVIEARKCYETARRHGKPVIIMEPVKGGNLANPPQPVADILKEASPTASPSSWALRYAASLEGIITVLSGMSSMAQMKENTAVMKAFQPLSKGERAAVEKAAQALSLLPAVPCTACAYCMKGCPMEIAIHGAFQAVNMARLYDNLPFAKNQYAWQTDGHGLNKASQCIACGRCEAVCPQHIHIREELKKAAAILEG